MLANTSFSATTAALRTFDSRHERFRCSYTIPDLDGTSETARRWPREVQRLNHDCAKLHVTRYSAYWNIALWLLLEEREHGRRYGGEVLEVSGQSFLRPYLTRAGTRFTSVGYPDVDVMRLSDAFPAERFDFVLLENVLEHVSNPQLAVLQVHRVLRPGGTFLFLVPSTYPYHFGAQDYWRMTPDALKACVYTSDEYVYTSDEYVYIYYLLLTTYTTTYYGG